MPAKYLSTEKSVRKRLKKLPLHIHGKVIKALDVIKSNPLSGTKLHGELKNYYKYRVGDYRVVYQFDSKTSTVIVVEVEHRQGVYR
jgi:mRNA interferase RelE/StbE